MAEGIVSGKRAGIPQPITSVDDSGTERLAVDAKVSGVVEAGLEEVGDRVAVFGGIDGSETADTATRQIVNVDSSGRPRVVGGAADGAAPAGDPVLIAGSDGAAVQTARTDTTGNVGVYAKSSTSAAADGISNTPARPTTEAGSATVFQWGYWWHFNGTTWDRVRGDTNGTQIQGAVADGGVPAGNPVLIGGSDGTNVQTARVDTTGNQATYPKTLSAAFSDNLSGTQSFAVAENGTTVASVPFNYYYDGIGNNWDRMRGNAAGGMVVQGPVAHDAVVQGNPVFLGHQAVAHGANPADVAVGDISVWWTNRQGVPFIMGGHPNIRSTEYNWTTAQTNDDMLGTIAAGTKVIVTSICLTLDEATTVGVSVRVGFGTASVPAAPADGASVEGVILSHRGTVPGGGLMKGTGAGIIGIGGDGEELRVTCEAPTSGTATLVVTWYTVAS